MLKSPTTSSPIAEISYQNFINSVRSEETKTKYLDALNKYMEFLGLKEGDRNNRILLLLEEQDPRVIDNNVIRYIVNLKNEGCHL